MSSAKPVDGIIFPDDILPHFVLNIKIRRLNALLHSTCSFIDFSLNPLNILAASSIIFN